MLGDVGQENSGDIPFLGTSGPTWCPTLVNPGASALLYVARHFIHSEDDREKTMNYKDFTSLPPEQEQSFVVYERTSNENSKKAMTLGIIAGVAVGVIAIILYIAVEPPVSSHAVPQETDLAEEVVPAAAPAPVEPTPAEPTPAEAPAAEATAPAAAATTEAPAPPKGATKAPPTALMGE